MPRMSKKRREEWSFFLNRRNRIMQYHVVRFRREPGARLVLLGHNSAKRLLCPICRGCTQDCKQSFRMGIVVCDRYWSKRWKPQEERR